MHKFEKIPSWSKIVFILLSIIIVPVLISVFMTQYENVGIFKNVQGDWLSFWGAYLGAILAIAGAYLTIRIQIKNERLLHHYEIVESERPYFNIDKLGAMDLEFSFYNKAHSVLNFAEVYTKGSVTFSSCDKSCQISSKNCGTLYNKFSIGHIMYTGNCTKVEFSENNKKAEQNLNEFISRKLKDDTRLMAVASKIESVIIKANTLQGEEILLFYIKDSISAEHFVVNNEAPFDKTFKNLDSCTKAKQIFKEFKKYCESATYIDDDDNEHPNFIK